MTYLLDVNLLIALCDRDHVHCSTAKRWYRKQMLSRHGWATCPLTENAFLRVFGHPEYPGGPGSPAHARIFLQQLRSVAGHQFWPDNFSLADTRLIRAFDGVKPKMLTDIYLLGLAVHRRAKFASLDGRLEPGWLVGGPEAYVCVNA